MYNKIFEEIGLSPNEAKIYETLISAGESPVSYISIRSNIHRRNVYDTLNRLIEKGLVFKIFQKGESRYQAAHPNKLMGALKEKEKHLNNIMPNLKELYEAEIPEEAAYIYKGVEGYKNYHNDVLRVGKEILLLGAKGLWLSKGAELDTNEDYIKVLEKQKIPIKGLFVPQVKNKLPKLSKYKYGEFKFLPDGYYTQAGVDIFGDYVVTLNNPNIGQVDENTTILVVRNQVIADSYRIWFKFMWENCPDIK